MTSNLQFDFLVDKEKNTLTIRREFMAGRQLVWDCHTKSELLEQWFAPKPFTAKTKSMDFREGGHWHYAMVSPEGEEYWGWTEYRTIKPIDFYTSFDAFCNEDGETNKDLPSADWKVTFTDKGAHAIVETLITYNSLADLETVIKMGMQEGMTMTLEQLDKLLENMATKITVETIVSADLTKVWNAYTSPEHITKWNFASEDWHCPKAENDIRVGGKYMAKMEAKDGSFAFDFEAVYDEVIDQEQFTYTMPDGRAVTTSFEAKDGQTKVTTVFDAEQQNPADMQQQGWQAILNNFKKYVEGI